MSVGVYSVYICVCVRAYDESVCACLCAIVWECVHVCVCMCENVCHACVRMCVMHVWECVRVCENVCAVYSLHAHQQYCLNCGQVSSNDVGMVGGSSLGRGSSDEWTDVRHTLVI